MRIFAISDIHVDFDENYRWVDSLSGYDYQHDILIVAGDVTDNMPLFEKTLRKLRDRFYQVLYIPGNHDLWVRPNVMKDYKDAKDSLAKLEFISVVAADCGVRMEPFHQDSLAIIPLFGWYDYSFGYPSPETLAAWSDFVAVKWPGHYDEKGITRYFIAMNDAFLAQDYQGQWVISFSHFLPRIDIMPFYIPNDKRSLYPVLGTALLDEQIRKLGSRIHVYGHSHVNQQIMKDDTLYINNAYGYPYETHIAAKELKCIYEV